MADDVMERMDARIRELSKEWWEENPFLSGMPGKVQSSISGLAWAEELEKEAERMAATGHDECLRSAARYIRQQCEDR